MARAFRSAALLALVALTLATCGRPGAPSRSGFDPHEAFQGVLELKHAADAARLESARRDEAAEPGRVDRARSSRENADQAFRASLVRFLNTALNESPRAPETHQALELYAREAETILDESERLGGSPQGILDALTATAKACREAGVEEPPELRAALHRARAAAAPTPSGGRAP